MRYPILVLGLLAAGCPIVDPLSHEPATAPDHSAFIRRAADEYRSWGVVGPHVLWAPELCMAPPPPSVHVTEAMGLASDGHKLFALYASDGGGYLKGTGDGGTDEFPVGMTLVKEAYEPVPIFTELPVPWTLETQPIIEKHGFYPFATRGQAKYTIGARRDLFVMTKLAPETPDTDEGWIYGTVAPDGTVTSAGLVESCMECHDSAPHERLFGVRFTD